MSQLKIHISFDPSVTAASAAFATHKYNKEGALCFQFDDGSRGITVADDLWNGYTYTDGCGNTRSYKGSVGMNRGTGVAGSNDHIEGVFTGPELTALINKGHDIENHSYYHTGNTDTPPTQEDLQKALISVLYEDDVINKYTAYKMNGFIIPQNFTGFDVASAQLGYLSCISEGTDPYVSGSTIYQGNIPDAIGDIPGFFRITRFYNDDWANNGTLDQYKSAFDNVVNGTKNIMCMFTHSLLTGPGELDNFTDLFNYFRTHANDNILFASLRETLEYTQIRKVPLSQALTGNLLTLTIETDDLNKRQRFMDCSFNISSDAAITGVSVEGFDNATYNASTKLVNAFKQKKVWSVPASPRTPDQEQNKFVKHGHFTAG